MNKLTFKRAVKAAGGTQTSLAKRLGITRQYVSMIKLGARVTPAIIKQIEEIANEWMDKR